VVDQVARDNKKKVVTKATKTKMTNKVPYIKKIIAKSTNKFDKKGYHKI
jgi:hypothetical protein